MSIRPKFYEIALFDKEERWHVSIGSHAIATSLQNAMAQMERLASLAGEDLSRYHILVVEKSYLSELLVMLSPWYHVNSQDRPTFVIKDKGGWRKLGEDSK